MKKICVLLLLLITGCRQSKIQPEQKEYDTFSFAEMEGKPIFEDEYMFDKVSKRYLVRKVNEVELYYVDWDNNDKFDEIGTDYVGVKMETEYKPTLDILMDTNYITLNGQVNRLINNNLEPKMQGLHHYRETKLNSLTEYFPIELTSGKVLDPEFQMDTTIIYFWATWCKPCVETIKQITPKLDELRANSIDFIPVAHDCGACAEFIDEHDLPYNYFHITEKAATQVNIKSLSKQLTFLRDKKLAVRNTSLNKYYF